MEAAQEFIQQYFKEIVIAIVGLLVLRWVWGRLMLVKRRHGGKHHSVVFCHHCNWEGAVPRANPKCKKCGSTDVAVKQA